jgi:DNA-binding NtrC family response regulator
MRHADPPTHGLRVLVVEDDHEMANHVEALLRTWGYETRTCGDGRGVRSTMHEWMPDLALVDLGLPDVDGLDLVRQLRTKQIDSVVISGRAGIDAAVQSVESGAFVFLEKPVSPMTLRSVLADAERRTLSARAIAGHLEDGEQRLGELVTTSDNMREALDLVRCVAPTDANVLIVGENGTGKELVANAIHAMSPRSAGPFVKINCAAIPDELMESELFGHRRGSFTGAIADRMGLFEAAHGGTLLLDEIGEMPQHLQTKLLRVLQERTARPVGGARQVDLDFRLLCATNCDLRAATTSGRFRQDLYFRINTITVSLPPLRERPDDIALLADQFLQRFSRQYARPLRSIDEAARQALLGHEWRGNVRELEHAIERAVIVARGSRLRLEDLPESLRAGRRSPRPGSSDTMLPLAEMERQAILRALDHTRGNKRAAAALLGVYRPTLYSKLRKYGLIEPPASPASRAREDKE